MNICVFCSANDVAETYTAATKEFAALVARGGHTLVWGGSNQGTMKVVADAAQSAGGKIVGITMELLRHMARQNADEMIVAEDLSKRKATMMDRSDAFVLMVGGIGTLDEVTGILELKKHRVHDKPIVVLNSEDFYEGLKSQLERMDAEGFLPRPIGELIYFAKTPKQAITYIDAHGA